jgi:hypothetical protein
LGSSTKIETQILVPYINAFEESLAENQGLLEDLQTRALTLGNSIDDESGDLHLKVQTMGDALTGLFSSFKKLEDTFEHGQSIAARSGKLIESLYRLRRRSMDAKELFLIFSDMASGKGTNRLDAILDSSSAETRTHGAKIMRRLKMLQEANIEGAEEATKIVGDLVVKYEEGLLEEFHTAFEENNMGQMRLAASLLMKYNGGQSCVQSFVAQHAFFTEPVQPDSIRSQYHSSRMVTSLDLGKLPEPDIALIAIFEQIAQTAEADWQYLEAVFEEPLSVMNYLMQRIFKEPVQVHIDEILSQARNHSTLAYLRTLFASYKATLSLIKRLGASYARHIKEAAARSSEISDIGIDETISMVTSQLNGLMEDLFAEHVKVEKYLELEQRLAEELYSMANAPLLNYLQTRRLASRNVISSVFSRSKDSPGSPRQSTVSEVLLLFADGQPLIRKGEGEEGTPSEIVVDHCLALHAEQTARLFILLPTDRRGLALEQSMKTFLTFIFERYIEASLDCALETGDYSTGFSSRSLEIVQASCRILSTVLLYCHNHFLPLIVTASSISYRNMVQNKTDAAGRITEKIDRLLRKELDTSLSWIEEQLLAKQRKSDFKPRPDDLESLMGPSQVTLTL